MKGTQELHEGGDKEKEGKTQKTGRRDSGLIRQRLISLELLHGALDEAGNPVILASGPGGEIVDCNRRAVELFGITPGKSRLSDIPGFGGKIGPGRVTAKGKGSGPSVDFDISLSEPGGHPLYVLIGRTVGPKEAERRYLLAIADTVEAVLWLEDLATNRYVYITPSYEKIWGRSREELYERPLAWLDSLHPEDTKRVKAALKRGKGESYDLEYRIVRPDGEVRWMHSKVVSLPHGEKGTSFRVGMALDVTERKEMERMLEESARFRAVNEALDAFGHDLNNFLLALERQIRIVCDKFPEAEPFMEEISRRTANLRVLLDDFRTRVGKATKGKRALDLHEWLRSELSNMGGEGVSIDIEPHAVFHRVRANEATLLRVFENLLRNALEAMADSGEKRITVRTWNEFVHEDSPLALWMHPCEAVVVEVRDTGPGVPPERKEAIFEFSKSWKRGKEDTPFARGLGLFSARKMMRECGGAIVEAGEYGKGAAFRLYFPLAGGGKRKPVALPARVRGSVLVVGKGDIERHQLSFLAHASGAAPETARDAAEAAERLEHFEYEAVLMSGELPPEEMERIAEIVMERTPGAPLLVMGRPSKIPPKIEALAEGGKVKFVPILPAKSPRRKGESRGKHA